MKKQIRIPQVSPCHFGPVSRDTEGGRVCWSEIREKTQSQGSLSFGESVHPGRIVMSQACSLDEIFFRAENKASFQDLPKEPVWLLTECKPLG